MTPEDRAKITMDYLKGEGGPTMNKESLERHVMMQRIEELDARLKNTSALLHAEAAGRNRAIAELETAQTETKRLRDLLARRAELPNVCWFCVEAGTEPAGKPEWDGTTLRCPKCGTDCLDGVP